MDDFSEEVGSGSPPKPGFDLPCDFDEIIGVRRGSFTPEVPV